MKLKIWCDSGANIHSCYEQVITEDELGYTEAEWDALTEDKKTEIAREIAFDRLDWGFRKL